MADIADLSAVPCIPAPRPAHRHQGQIRTSRTRLAPDVHLLTVAGEIDMAAMGEWRAALAAALAVPRLRRLICDCAELRFLSIGGFLALVDAHHTARGRGIEVRVVHPPRMMIRLLAVIGESTALRTDDYWISAAELVIPERDGFASFHAGYRSGEADPERRRTCHDRGADDA